MTMMMMVIILSQSPSLLSLSLSSSSIVLQDILKIHCLMITHTQTLNRESSVCFLHHSYAECYGSAIVLRKGMDRFIPR